MKKLLICSAGLAAAAFLAAGLAAMAQTSTTPPAAPVRSMPMMLQVGPQGKVLMRGTIDAMSSSSLTIKSWGGDWTVNIPASAEVLPAAAGKDISQFKTGDFVGVQGQVSASASWTIDATLVRDWTYRQEVNQERQQNIQAVHETVQSGPRNYQGTASAVGASSFTLTENGAAYTVDVAAGAKVLNRNWLTLSLSSIQNGDTVRVWGANASGTITAEIVRDISIPVAGY